MDQEKASHVNALTLCFRDSDKERQYQEDPDIGKEIDEPARLLPARLTINTPHTSPPQHSKMLYFRFSSLACLLPHLDPASWRITSTSSELSPSSLSCQDWFLILLSVNICRLSSCLAPLFCSSYFWRPLSGLPSFSCYSLLSDWGNFLWKYIFKCSINISRCIIWDLSRSFLLRLAITIFSIILIYTMAQVNVVSWKLISCEELDLY